MRTCHRGAAAVIAGLVGTACVMAGIARAATGSTSPSAVTSPASAPPASAPRYLHCPSPAKPTAPAPEPSRTGDVTTGKNGSVQIRATFTYPPGVAIRLGASGTPTEEVTNTSTEPNCSLITGGTVWVYDWGDRKGHLVASLAEKQRLLNAANFAGDPATWNPGQWYPVNP
jgi:hypothetical protein